MAEAYQKSAILSPLPPPLNLSSYKARPDLPLALNG